MKVQIPHTNNHSHSKLPGQVCGISRFFPPTSAIIHTTNAEINATIVAINRITPIHTHIISPHSLFFLREWSIVYCYYCVANTNQFFNKKYNIWYIFYDVYILFYRIIINIYSFSASYQPLIFLIKILPFSLTIHSRWSSAEAGAVMNLVRFIRR